MLNINLFIGTGNDNDIVAPVLVNKQISEKTTVFIIADAADKDYFLPEPASLDGLISTFSSWKLF